MGRSNNAWYKIDLQNRSLVFVSKYKYWISIFVCLVIWFSLCLPSTLFNDPLSTVIIDKNKNLLSASIATDEQWRFPVIDSVPENFKTAIINFEDRFFYYHPGVNLFSLFRALKQNIVGRRIISGGSTIPMQVIRLSRKGNHRTVYEKLVECILTLRLELSYSKDRILSLYVSNAPFGGNIVGLEAAAWRYFGRSHHQLSWAEVAVLAVLPNAPSLIRPGKNDDRLLKKRNRLLKKLLNRGHIGQTTYDLSIDEPLPSKPMALPRITPHILTRVRNQKMDANRITTTINFRMQKLANTVVNQHHNRLKKNEIYNAAALVLEVETGDVLAYVGNTNNIEAAHGSDVDIITSGRSTGSIMKPFLYTAMLMDGELLPKTLIPDIPTQISGYSPKNFDRNYCGAVPADEALYKSLNIPAILMLQSYGIEKFHDKLKRLKLSNITKPAEHYGLSIILGGAEATLWDITGIYASMARTLIHFTENNARYCNGDFHPPNFILNNSNKKKEFLNELPGIFSASSIWLTFNALMKVNRPREEQSALRYASWKNIAWKTGTSFGFRDGWAVGVTSKYVVGVWVGNADGEGRPGLTGLSAAAPILFDIFKHLPLSEAFPVPFDELEEIAVCKRSGCRLSRSCQDGDTLFVPLSGLKTPACNHCRLVHLNRKRTHRVTSKCEKLANIIHEKWFVLPPIQEWYYKSRNPDYYVLPPIKLGCQTENDEGFMDIIYPKKLTQIFVPKEFDGKIGKTVFKIAHRTPQSTIFWHLDDKYIGYTKEIHEMGLSPSTGHHIITLVDNNGETLIRKFEIIDK